MGKSSVSASRNSISRQSRVGGVSRPGPVALKHNLSRMVLLGGVQYSNASVPKYNLSRMASGAKPDAYSAVANARRVAMIKVDAFIRNATLFGRVGGVAVVDQFVRMFYGRALMDPRLQSFMNWGDAGATESAVLDQIGVISAMMGGVSFPGMSPEQACGVLARSGFGATQFEAVLEHVASIGHTLNMPPPVLDELLSFCTRMRWEIAPG